MTEKKTFEERYGDEILSDNSALNHYGRCKDCIYRDKTIVQGQEYGWNKCYCHIYGKTTASRLNVPYVPANSPDKPDEVYNNTGECEYYEKEKRRK